jgi:hypothetical protein
VLLHLVQCLLAELFGWQSGRVDCGERRRASVDLWLEQSVVARFRFTILRNGRWEEMHAIVDSFLKGNDVGQESAGDHDRERTLKSVKDKICPVPASARDFCEMKIAQ